MQYVLYINFIYLPQNIILELVRIGSSDVERSMRDYYEELYIGETDENHNFFKNNVLRQSPFINCKNDYALS